MSANQAAADVQIDDRRALVVLSGAWTIDSERRDTQAVLAAIEGGDAIDVVGFDASRLERWDSMLLALLRTLKRKTSERSIAFNVDGLPDGAVRMLELADAVPARAGAARAAERKPLLDRIGDDTKSALKAGGEFVDFIGAASLAVGRLFRGASCFKLNDLMVVIEDVGARALPVVGLISFLAGLILAFMGGVQLAYFGAEVYVANLVAIGMAREMAPLMAGIIMAGRTGAAFAAELGTMQVNEEIDALETLGISPMDFLVVPRLLAMMLMMPLLTLYADFLGLLGGGVIGVVLFDITPLQYYYQTLEFVGIKDFAAGLFKGFVFGIIVACAGCLRGMQCGRSSAAVGHAATSAVVTGIVLIVIATSLLTVVYYVVGI